MGGGPTLHDALVGALDRSLVVALLASLVAAAVIAALVARRILRPISEVRAATRRLAAGRYDRHVAPPVELELAALAADVNSLARSLDDTERRRVELVSDVAHELRTPLTTIRGYAEGMLDGIVAPDDEVLTTVLGEVDRLQRLAADLGTLSRADEGALDLVLVSVDLAALAAAVVSGFQRRGQRQGGPAHCRFRDAHHGDRRPRPARAGAREPGRQRHHLHRPAAAWRWTSPGTTSSAPWRSATRGLGSRPTTWTTSSSASTASRGWNGRRVGALSASASPGPSLVRMAAT
jgi:signal transduction histidine kinase